MSITLFSHPECALHQVDDEHPESPARINGINDQLIASGIDLFVTHKDASLIDIDTLKHTHSEAYIDDLLQKDQQLQANSESSTSPHIMLDDDTVMMAGSLQAARRAAGAVVDAVDEVMGSGNKRAFCAVRPPGHHALRDRAMGFCLLSNIAIAAHYAQRQYNLQSIAIVDFDVHHGNGTEDIVQGDPHITLFSSYQKDFYPFPDASAAKSNVIHTPLPAGSSGAEFRQAVTPWFDQLEQLQPQLIFISAGFDAHNEDPMAHLRLNESDYIWITQRLVTIANTHCEGRIVSVLEGGYDISALGRSVVAHIKVLIEN